MPEPTIKKLKLDLPVELFDQLSKAAAEDDRDLDKFVIRLLKQCMAGPVPVAPVRLSPYVPPAVSAPQSDKPAVARSVEQAFVEAPGKAQAFALKPGMPGTPAAVIESDPLSGQSVEPVVRARPIAPRPAGQENLFPAHKSV